MADESKQLSELVEKFRALKTHAEKCAFLHDEKNYPILGRIYSTVHYPKPAAKPETEQ
jgi:hypothetical protein